MGEVFDLLIQNVILEEGGATTDIAVRNGLIAAIAPSIRGEAVETVDAGGAFAFGGFVESHIHLDKACILDRCAICEGTLAEAVRETAAAKSAFSEDDVYRRASKVVRRAVSHGTTRMRTFVEIDPRAGFRSFEAIKRVRADYEFALDIEICAFAQEGLSNEPETVAMLDEALADGADLIGGCPYTDPDPRTHVELIFELAEKHGVAVDFHLDFDLTPETTNLPIVVSETIARGWQGRVTIGHVTNLSVMSPSKVARIANDLLNAGIALTVLPATDLFLNGRSLDHSIPRGVAPAHLLARSGVLTTIATNNVLNPFTPYGDASLARMANLFANVSQLSKADDLQHTFDMVSSFPARLMGYDQSLKVGGEATIVLLDAKGPLSTIREIAPTLAGWKRGRKSFENPPAVILEPLKKSS